MKSFVLSLAILGGLAQPALAQALKPCAVTVITPPVLPPIEDEISPGWRRVPENAAGCTLGVPLVADVETTLWRCMIEYPEGEEIDEDAPEYAILLKRGSQPIEALRDEVMAIQLDAYQVLKADLDGDGRQERVLAAWNAQGNGLGINTWTIRVFNEGWGLVAEYHEVLDWGRTSLVEAPAGRKGCDLALTSYEEFGPEAPGSTAFEARFVRLAGGQMVEAADRPPVRCRLTNAFMSQRTAFFEKNEDSYEGDVAAWLSRGELVPNTPLTLDG